MKNFFLTALCVFGFVATSYGQATITLTEDLVLTETMNFTESTTVIGNGFSISCDGCDPMINVAEGVDVDFQNVNFRRGYTKWLNHEGANGSVTWTGPRMSGSTVWTGGNEE